MAAMHIIIAMMMGLVFATLVLPIAIGDLIVIGSYGVQLAIEVSMLCPQPQLAINKSYPI